MSTTIPTVLFHPLDRVYTTQKFGENPDIYDQFGMKGHNGIDYRTRFFDTPLGHMYVSAAADGEVIQSAVDGGYGNAIRILHADGSITIYAHLSKFYVWKGMHVKAQQIIGLTGGGKIDKQPGRGFSTGPHLHFGYRPKGWQNNTNNGYFGWIDPTSFMSQILPKQFFAKK